MKLSVRQSLQCQQCRKLSVCEIASVFLAATSILIASQRHCADSLPFIVSRVFAKRNPFKTVTVAGQFKSSEGSPELFMDKSLKV